MEKLKKRFALLIFTVAIAFLLLFGKIDDYPVLLGFYTLAFLSYVFIVQKFSWTVLLSLSFGLRFLAVFCFPGLSDDIYRFIWDGWLITEGINPYLYLPVDVPLTLNGFQENLLEKMNSPSYYSVYPTILQALFSFAVFVIPTNLFGQMVVIKLILLLAEYGTLVFGVKVLEKMGKDKKWIFMYLLNPLVVVELMGNMHMELLMIFGFAVFLWGLQAQRNWLGSIFGLVFSISSKLVTAIAIPFLIRRLPIKDWWKWGLVSFTSLVILFLPMFLGSYENFGKGLDLYFQKFEFNASFYFLFREIGFLTKGYNVIGKLGPVLAVISAITVLVLAWREKEASVESLCVHVTIALTVYYSLSTTVHPWYISLLVFLSIFTHLRYAYVWSFVAVFSYAKYYGGGDMYYWMIGMEYVVLWIFIVQEIKGGRKR